MPAACKWRNLMRFTLSKLFFAVAMAAVACTGIIFHTVWWADGILFLTLALYLIAAIQGISLRGHDRAAAFAFLLTGVIYLSLIVTNAAAVVRNSLITNDILESMYQCVPQSPPESSPRFAPEYPWHHLDWLFADGMQGEPRRHFVLIGHCVWSWLFAMLASWFAVWTYAKREKL
jgi:hypothetical protein